MASEYLLPGLAAAAFIPRIAASGSLTTRSVAARLAAFVLSGMSAWLLASVAGLWTPWWPFFASALVGLVLLSAVGDVAGRPIFDAAVMAVFCALAKPVAGVDFAVKMICAFSVAGFLVDLAATRLWKPPRHLLTATTTVCVLALISSMFWMASKRTTPTASRLLFMGIMRASAGERINLPSGAVAWFNPVPGGRPALLLHGNHPRGSHQASAAALRKALSADGYSVLSLDHIGYGASPRPDIQAPVAAWEPMRGVGEAFDFLGKQFGTEPVLIVGHSMGTGDALRALALKRPIRAAVLFGSGLPDPQARDSYWFDRFHKDRLMSEAKLSVDQWRTIRARYYDTARAARGLPKNHAPVIFVRFEYEHHDISAGRDALFALISAPKSLADHPGTTHYLNSVALPGQLVAADVRDEEILAREVGQWLQKNQ